MKSIMHESEPSCIVLKKTNSKSCLTCFIKSTTSNLARASDYDNKQHTETEIMV